MLFTVKRTVQTAIAGALVMCGLVGCGQVSSQVTEATSASRLPNVIYILVDDMGYGDIEPFGQTKIKTPSLDYLADHGLVFTQHYAGNTVCAPSRATLITGQHSGHNQIRGNFELGGYEDHEEFGQLPLQPGTLTLPKVMKRAGYNTALIGKWGLGGPDSYGMPTRQGFDYFFGYMDQKQAHNHYPTHLWQNEERFPLNNEWLHPHGGFEKGEDPNDPASYEQFKRPDFAQQRLTDEALRFVKDNKDTPFFLYLAYAAPHAALQAPDEEVDAYDFDESPYDGTTRGKYVPVFKPRATRAAMISHIDKGVGALLDQLREQGLEKDTLIIFSSDNGPTSVGGSDVEFFDSNGPFRGYKRDLYEGGIRMPTIAYWPAKVASGSVTNHVSAFWDVLPTLAELAGVSLDEKEQRSLDGISFLPTLLGQGEQPQHDHLYWEFHHFNGSHSQAVRIQDMNGADWKAVRHFNKRNKQGSAIELYNLSRDASETTDVAAQHPELIEKAQQLFVSSRKRSFIDKWNFDTYR